MAHSGRTSCWWTKPLRGRSLIHAPVEITTFLVFSYSNHAGSAIPHRRALEALEYCRHQHGTHMLAQCPEKQCRHVLYIPHSCGHRFCPHCQSHESQQWIDNQRAKLLSAPYYLVTFTLPRPLRDLAYKNQRRDYACMFQAGQQALKTFTTHDTKLGGDGGFTAMLLAPPLRSPDENYHDHAATATTRKSRVVYLILNGGPPIQNSTSLAVQKNRCKPALDTCALKSAGWLRCALILAESCLKNQLRLPNPAFSSAQSR